MAKGEIESWAREVDESQHGNVMRSQDRFRDDEHVQQISPNKRKKELNTPDSEYSDYKQRGNESEKLFRDLPHQSFRNYDNYAKYEHQDYRRKMNENQINFPTFFFKPRREKLNWRAIHQIDINKVQDDVDIDTLESITKNLAFARLESRGAW
jgi:hypothetical protein